MTVIRGILNLDPELPIPPCSEVRKGSIPLYVSQVEGSPVCVRIRPM